MFNIQSMDAKAFVENSKAKFFQIFLVTDNELLSWTDAGFHNAEIASRGFLNIQLFSREDAVRAYGRALNDAKTIKDGVLEMVEIPLNR